MKTKVMDAMQSFSKALIGPVLFLPLAGMIQALSSIMCNTSIVAEGSAIYMIGTFINGGVGTVMSNLGILFCVGITMNLAKKRKADAAFVSLISYLIWLAANSKWLSVAGLMAEGSTASDLYGTGQTIYLGFHVTDMGVFLGMILGVVVAVVHNRFIDTEFKGAFALYGNSKFVFIVMLPIVFVLALAAAYVWPVAAMAINALTGIMSTAGAFGVFLYGFLNRILIPTGLHHLVWSPFLWSSIGDSMIINGELISGAKSVFLALLSDPTAPMSDSTRFLTYGLMKTFGVIGVALAFIKTAKKNKKAACKAQVIPSMLTACLPGRRHRTAGVQLPVCGPRAVGSLLGHGRPVPDRRLPAGRPCVRHQRHHRLPDPQPARRHRPHPLADVRAGRPGGDRGHVLPVLRPYHQAEPQDPRA